MSENQDLTILLTLWDRVPCTFRWMTYAGKVNLPFKVLIADGGSDESVSQVLTDRDSFPKVDYEYIRYPYDATPTHYYKKVLDALGRVKTPFVVFADNDDFYLIEALRRSVEFLKHNPDFSSCRGIIGGVRITPDAGYGELSNIYGEDVSFVRQVYPPDQSNLEETALKRVHNYFASYRPNWYDVSRTEPTRENFQVLHDLDTQDLILSQHITMLLGVIAGKVQIEPYLYLLRQLDGPSSVDQTETKQKGDLFDRMLMESWSGDFKGFVNAIAAALARKDGLTVDEARREIRQGYRNFIAPHLASCLVKPAAPTGRPGIARTLISRLGPIGTGLRKLYPPVQKMIKGRPMVGGRDFIPAAELLEADDDFKLIYDFLAAPPCPIKGSPQAQVSGSLEYSSS
jgi:glycosyltransferase domain-containing protein